MIMSLKQRKMKFEPRIKLNHNIYIYLYFKNKEYQVDIIKTKSVYMA